MEILPAPEAKWRLMESYAQKHDLKVFIETGTARGDSLQAARSWAEEMHSIELSRPVYEDAVFRFSEVIHRERVHLYYGDSQKILRAICASVLRPALFWLDAHCDGVVTPVIPCETPIIAELNVINNLSAGGVVLVDDAELFGKSNYTRYQWPTIQELAAEMNNGWTVSLMDNVLRFEKRP